MPVNANKPNLWKADIARSVDFYNEWFMRFAPKAFRASRGEATDKVMRALAQTANLTRIEPAVLLDDPTVIMMLRMCTAPPLARDRLIGLAGVSPNLVRSMEIRGRVPNRMPAEEIAAELDKVGSIVLRLVDKDIFSWLGTGQSPAEQDVFRAATVVADRLCGATADPIIRNAQEERQIGSIRSWLEEKGYRLLDGDERGELQAMPPGTFAFHVNAPIHQRDGVRRVMISIDVAIMPLVPVTDQLPLLVEAKSAGDFTNPNKRRKEEATKINQLRSTYGTQIRYILFLCGYFDASYLGYEAAEGIDWVWEHRIDDLAELGL
ncbi:MAG: XamI family restriction endonuclease [Anaerolineae bacterium]|nr:XamI family restriction endonuclease [Anaerolineae bacterium]